MPSLKVVQITIPYDRDLPEIISTFSPDESYQMLKIGSEALEEGRKVITNLTNEEIYKKLDSDFKKERESLSYEIEVEKRTSLKMQDKISKMYQSQLEQLNDKLEKAMIQIENYEKNLSGYVEEKVNKVKQKYDLLLEEKDRQNQLNREAFDKAVKLLDKSANKSSISLGDDGEQIFENLTDTFKDFPEFRIENKAKQSHKGDFHLFFKDFNILVDSKNYKGSVQKKEILKIESDLNTNSNMNFAWLVSLNSNICDFNKFPITPKWISTDDGQVKCILMINNLLDNKEPRNVLRQAWQICEDFYKLTKKVEKEDGELEQIREKNLVFKKQINILQDRVSEMRRSMNITYNTLKNMDKDLIDLLTLISDNVINEKYKLENMVKKWWDDCIEYDNDDSKMTSTEIWSKFKKDNKDFILENKLTIEIFKDIITGLVDSSHYIEKTKKGAIDFTGIKWKIVENIEPENVGIIQLENLVLEKTNIVKKQKKQKKTELYFNEEIDKQIINDYSNEENDIMSMSNDNIRPWQIVSLLIRYKIINKRSDARGYDKYKETDEYKIKLNKELLGM